MLIIALVLAVIGLAALVFAVVTSNELVAWVCIAASVIGVVLLVIDALQERKRHQTDTATNAAGQDGPKPRAEEVTADYDQVSAAGDAGTQEVHYTDYPEDASGEDDESTEEAGGEQVPVRSADSGSDDDADDGDEPKA
ncbi:hypothetical protein [Mycobacterium sp.]|uniref:hypothetical protein n=1 Tax=Mycobacterium sp. TaxID=1785 RepID=UPI003D6ACE87